MSIPCALNHVANLVLILDNKYLLSEIGFLLSLFALIKDFIIIRISFLFIKNNKSRLY